MDVTKKHTDIPSYSVFNAKAAGYFFYCANCNGEYKYSLTKEENVKLYGRYYKHECVLENISERIWVPERYQICEHCFAVQRDSEYKELMCRIDENCKALVDDYLYGIGNIGDIEVWLGTGLTSAIEEFKAKYIKQD